MTRAEIAVALADVQKELAVLRAAALVAGGLGPEQAERVLVLELRQSDLWQKWHLTARAGCGRLMA